MWLVIQAIPKNQPTNQRIRPAYQHTKSQTHQHTNTPTHQHTNTPTHQHTNTPTRQYANTAPRSQALGHCLGKGARGKARRPIRLVTSALCSAMQSSRVVDSLASSGLALGALAAAADTHAAAELLSRWPGVSLVASVLLSEVTLIVLIQLLVAGSGQVLWRAFM